MGTIIKKRYLLKIQSQILVVLGIMLFTTVSQGADKIVWNGFASFFGRQSLTDIYDNGHNSFNGKDLNFSDSTRVGLNLRSELSQEFALVGQIVAAQRGTNDSAKWSPEFDWIFLNYTPQDNLNIRVGRQLNPGSIVGEYIDVGYTYPWRRLPLPYEFMVQFKSFEGISAAYSVDLNDKNLSIMAFGGNSRPYTVSVPQYTYEIKRLYGMRIRLEGENWEVQAVGANYKYLGYNPSFTVGVPATASDSGADSRLTIVGARYDDGKLLAYAEYSNIDCDKQGTPVCGGWAYYGTLGYHVSNWTPHYTYAKGGFQQAIPFVPASVSGPNNITSQTVGLNYQLNPSVVAKTEYMWQTNEGTGRLMMSGTGEARSYSFGVDLVF